MITKFAIAAVVFAAFSASLVYAEDTSTEAAGKYQALLQQFEQEGGARSFARQFLSLAEAHEDDPAAVDALLWVIREVPGRSETDTALRRLAEQHLRSEKLGPACPEIAASRSGQAEPLLRSLLEKSPHTAVRAQAGLHLAALLKREAHIVDQLRAQPDLAPRVQQYYGREYGQHLASLDPKELEQELEAVYELLLESYSEASIGDQKLGEIAEKELFRIRHLSVGKVAPEIAGEDVYGKSLRLSDFRGKVVMLTFWGHW